MLWLRDRGNLAEEGEIESLTADPDDDYHIALAMASDADSVVSGDKHLLDLEGEYLPRVVRPAEFLSSPSAG